MPKIYASTALAAIVAAGIIATLSVSSAQVIGTLRTPVAQCLETNTPFVDFKTPLGGVIERFPCQGSGVWLRLSSLRATLEPLGVTFQEAVYENTEYSKQLFLFFPKSGTASLYLQTSFTLTAPPANKVEKIELSNDFVSANTFVDALRNISAPLTMSGWSNPVLRVGATRFQVGSAMTTVRGEDWYPSVLQPRLQVLFNGWSSEYAFPDTANMSERQAQIYGTPLWFRSYNHSIQTGFAAGQIVVVASREPSFSYQYEGKTTVQPAFTRTYIAPVGKDGILEYPSDAKTLRFKDDLRGLSVTPEDGAGDIAVLKFTSDLSYNKKSFELVPSSKLSK